MSKTGVLPTVTATLILLAGCATIQEPTIEPESATYKVIVKGYDWGPAIRTLVIDIGQPVRASSISKHSFAVYVERKYIPSGDIVQVMNWTTMKTYPSKGNREVVAAYLCDANGHRSDAESGKYIALELKIGPEVVLSSPLNFDFTTFLNSFVKVEQTITQTAPLLAADGKTRINGIVLGPNKATATVYPIADSFDTKGIREYDDPKYGKITLHYASYAPAGDGRKHPLIIWLHGAGEGGTNPYVLLLGNRVTALATNPIQRIMGGAYVLCPQSPNVWMNNGVQSYPEDGSTQYVGAVKALIDSYVAKNPDIDPNRIYIGGCSNGGYMTMAMIMAYPGFFAAAFPICEAYADKWITEKQIDSIAHLPIWFTQAKSDTTVKAAEGGYVIQTYKRLLAAGGRNIHLTYWDKVEDLTGKYFKADGKTPYEYNGHWSWIYTLDNECTKDFDGSAVQLDGHDTTIMQWLAAQSRE